MFRPDSGVEVGVRLREGVCFGREGWACVRRSASTMLGVDGRVRFLLRGIGTVVNERGGVLEAGVHESGVVAFVQLL